MDCTIQQTEFLKDIEGSISNTTPVVRYVCETDRLLFAIPHLIHKLGVLKDEWVYLCDIQGRCLIAGNTQEESIQKFKEFIANLLYKKRV